MTARSPRVAVVAPSPVLTITVEPGDEIHLHAGGQGIWVARMCSRLGADAAVCCAFGGESGDVLRSLLIKEGISLAYVEAQVNNGAYVHDRRTGDREVVAQMPGAALGRHAADDLYSAALAHGLGASVTVLTGTDPADIVSASFYQRLATDLRANGQTVVADLAGPALDAVIGARPAVVKVSEDELVAEGRAAAEPAALTEWMLAAHRDGAANLIVTRGPQPALALLDGELVAVRAPAATAKDPRGAGDSLTAALATALAESASLQDALRLGVAAGMMNVTRSGLGTGRPEDIRAMAERVTVTSWSGQVPRHGSQTMSARGAVRALQLGVRQADQGSGR
ncbi:MAG TPA: PfkB family carbohydrate kinase [Streptosporangiaceae bacterium]